MNLGIQTEENRDASGSTSYSMQLRFSPDSADGIEIAISGTVISIAPVGDASNLDLDLLSKGSGDVTVNGAAIGGGGGVDVTVDFGASFTDRASTVVTGQAWVQTGQSIVATAKAASASELEELLILGLVPVVSDVVNGTGFTLSVRAPVEAKGTYTFSCIGV